MTTALLKDGTAVVDPRLDRVKWFDEESRGYGVIERRNLGAANPETVMWHLRPDFYLDQGREGQCVSYAFGHELSARPSILHGFTQAMLRDWYYRMQYLDPWHGGEYPGAHPRYAGTAVLAGAKVHTELGHFAGYDWAFGEEQLRIGLQAGPAVIGIDWHDGMFTPNARGFIEPTGPRLGGHAILVQGYNARFDFYTLVNSWGRGWGRKGKCYLSRPDMGALLAADGECCIPKMRTTRLNSDPVRWAA